MVQLPRGSHQDASMPVSPSLAFPACIHQVLDIGSYYPSESRHPRHYQRPLEGASALLSRHSSTPALVIGHSSPGSLAEGR